MIRRILCLLLDHRPDYLFGVKIMLDDLRWHRFGVRACERCGSCYIAFHRLQSTYERRAVWKNQTTDAIEHLTDYPPQSQAQIDSDARFFAELEAQPEGDGTEADFYDPSDRF